MPGARPQAFLIEKRTMTDASDKIYHIFISRQSPTATLFTAQQHSEKIFMPLTERLSSRVAAEALALAGSEPRGVPAVIDTNVVLDLIYWEDPHSEDLRRALEEGRIHALRSGEAVMELAEVLSRPAFTGDEDEAARLAALWCSMSVPVDEEKIREAADVITVQCRDPLDQKFFTLTLAGGAKLLVSKDKLVLKAGRKMQRYGACAFRPEETAARLDALS